MSLSVDYQRPRGIHRTNTSVSNSRFICTINCVDSTIAARHFVEQIRREMPDASHHPYAFRIGYGNSIIEGMTDDGEPTGTAGPPILAVLRGSEIGDIIIVVTRYFGGAKLGTGGLVRAYTQAAQVGLSELPTERNISKSALGIETPYPFYEKITRVIQQFSGEVEEETFTDKVTIIVQIPQQDVEQFERTLGEITAGQVSAFLLN